MSYNFVSIWTVDDTQPPARPPVASSDLYATSGSILSQISTVYVEARNTTTNALSQDLFVNRFTPLSVVNTKALGGIPTNPVPGASGPYTAPGGQVSTITIAPTLSSAVAPN
jgi:hypothetical protein